MNNSSLAPIIAPTIFRYTDIDAFRSSVRHLNVDFTPLARKISAEQIILNLPGCDVNYTKSFPRIIDAQLGPDCTALAFTMDDGVPIRCNGVEEDRSALVIGGGDAVYTQVSGRRGNMRRLSLRPGLTIGVGPILVRASRYLKSAVWHTLRCAV